MTINRENYGIFIIDYFDGNLSGTEERQLMVFLDANPGLRQEFKNFEKVTLTKPNVAFPEKGKLKIPEIEAFNSIDRKNYESFFVLWHDGELNEADTKQLEQFLIRNPHLAAEMAIFEKACTTADKTVLFPNKALLKHRKPMYFQVSTITAAAAVLLLYLGFNFLFPHKNKTLSLHKTYKVAVLSPIPYKTLKSAFLRQETVLLKPQPKFSISETTPTFISKPLNIETLAPLSAYVQFNSFQAANDLLFPEGNRRREILESTLPVILQKPAKNTFFAKVLVKPFNRLTGLIALRKRQRKESGLHDKPFVKILEGSVSTFNFLTDNDVLFIKTYNSNGNLLKYQLLSDNFNINRDVRLASNKN